MTCPPKILIVAGSDSCGGAGLQADLNMSRYLNVYPLSTISCITAQSPFGMKAIEPASFEIFRLQLESSLESGKPKSVKIGMLPSDEHIRILFDFIRRENLHNVVADPIMAPTLGGKNLHENLWHNKDLFKKISKNIPLLTPNIPEAQTISDILNSRHSVNETANKQFTIDEIMKLGENILNSCDLKAILIKGGHNSGENAKEVQDVLIIKSLDNFEAKFNSYIFDNNIVKSINTHGTGCNLSSAIACNLAKGYEIVDAVGKAEKTLNTFLKFNSEIIFCDRKSNEPHFGPVAIINP